MFPLVPDKKCHFWIFLLILLYLLFLTTIAYGRSFVGGDDYFFHNARFEALMQGLQDGTFPSYIDYKGLYNYGYLVKPFYSDFILIPFAVLAIFTGKSFAYLSLFFSMTFLCGIFMYIFIQKVYKDRYAAVLGSLLYTFCLYRLYDLYHRAAWGEAFSFTFLPVVFLGLYYIIKGDYRKWYVIAIGFSLMIFTHVLSSLLLFITVCIILVIYNRSLLKEPKRLYYLVLAGAVTIIVTGYYLFPFFEQVASDTFYFQKFKYLPYTTAQSRLDFPTIMYGMIAGFTTGSQSIGIGLLLLLPLCFRFFVRSKDKESAKYLRSIDTGVIIGIFYILLTSGLAPWTKFPLSYLSFIQFPWRLYEFVCFFFALAGGYYLCLLCKGRNSKIAVLSTLVILLSVVIVINASSYKEMKVGPRLSDTELNETTHYTMAGMEYYPAAMPFPDTFIRDRGDSVISQTRKTAITVFVRDRNITAFNVNVEMKDSLELPLIYYKGYAATLNGKDIPVAGSRNGLVQIPVDQTGRVEVFYKGTLIQMLGFYTTILAIFALCIYIFIQRRKKPFKNLR